MTLLELAERVEAATGPDRELDVAIAVAVDWRWPDWEEGESTARGQAEKHGLEWLVDRCVNGMASAWRGIPAYTSSLDAAMTLVPEGWQPLIDCRGESAAVTLYPPDYDPSDWHLKETGDGRASTPALALTAACLRARAASVDTHPQGGDANAAPFMSGAVGAEGDETPNPPIHPSKGSLT